MEDFLGERLEIGDTVIFFEPGYRNFTKGKIIKFTPQKVKVEWTGHRNWTSTYTEHPTTFVKIPLIQED